MGMTQQYFTPSLNLICAILPTMFCVFPWYSGMGWTVGTGCSKWDTWVRSQSVHSFPWYSGMGWTVGTGYTKWDTVEWDTVAWDTVEWDTVEWDEQ